MGGGSGGGSGGWLIVDAQEFDLSDAQPNASATLGGQGGPGKDNLPGVTGAGGNGGPGVIQLHTPSGTASEIVLPAGSSVDDLGSPASIVLLPAFQ